jgi:hypothetical protein
MSDEEPFIIDMTTDRDNDEQEVHPCIPECAEVCIPFGISLNSDDFLNHLLPHTRLNDRIIDAAVACLMHTYILGDPRGDTICMAVDCSFLRLLQIFNHRTPIPRSRATLITFTSRVTLPSMAFIDQLRQAPSEKLSLVFIPLLVESDHWALLVFCFHRKSCFFFDERANRDIALQPARGAFSAITLFFKELWNVEAASWVFVDVVPPLPHQDIWGPHVHSAFSCGVNVLQIVHRLLRNFRRTHDPASLEMAYPPTCLCASYRAVIDETLRESGVPVAYVGLN